MTCTSPVNGHVFSYDVNAMWGDDFSSRIQAHEYPTNTKLLELIKKAPVGAYIVDAGAHVGDTGLLMASEAKSLGRKVHILEVDPEPTKLKFIEETAALNGLHDLIETHQCAVGSEAGTGALCKVHASGAAVHAGAWFVVGGAEFTIERLDDILPAESDVFLIKLDTEGYEVDALMGCIGTIERSRPAYIMVEMWEPVLARHGRSVTEIMGFMETQKYRLIWKGGQDALFVAAGLHDTTGYWEERHHTTGMLTRWLPVAAEDADGEFVSAASSAWRATFRDGEFMPHNKPALRGGRVAVLSRISCEAPSWCGHGSSFRYRLD